MAAAHTGLLSVQAMLGGKANPGADDVKKILGSGACQLANSAAAVPSQPPAAAGQQGLTEGVEAAYECFNYPAGLCFNQQ